MKKKLGWLVGLAVVLMAGAVWAAPFMVCDPQAGVTHYKLTGPVWLPATSLALPDGSVHQDVGMAAAGILNQLTIAACKVDLVWGEQCSGTVPFSFTRPSAPGVPGGVKLVP